MNRSLRIGCPAKLVLAAFLIGGCGTQALDEGPDVLFARFDPDEKVLPKPTDILRNNDTGLLDIEPDEDMSPAEVEMVDFFNTLDGWSTTSEATVEFTDAILATSVNTDTLQVWQWRNGQAVGKVAGVEYTVEREGKKITIAPPEGGWDRGTTYSIFLRGGAEGVIGLNGQKVIADAAFYYLRSKKSLTDSKYFRAFPGDTYAERKESAEDLEEIRQKLVPYFDHVEKERAIPREEIAALWTFTTTARIEVAMDKASSRMPLPVNLLIDQKTGFVDIPVTDGDSEMVSHAKELLRGYRGFGTSMNPMFSFTGPVDPTTLTTNTVRLIKMGATPSVIPVEIEVADDQKRVQLNLVKPPLDPDTSYAVVLSKGIKDIEGRPVIPMSAGQLLLGKSAVAIDGVSQLESVEHDSARQLEPVRQEMTTILDQLGRENVVAAWPFTTMEILPTLKQARHMAKTLNVDPDPQAITSKSALNAVLDFPAAVVSLWRVKKVFYGTIKTVDFIDPETRERYPDGKYKIRDIPFVMSIPNNADPSKPLPVVMFGHGLMTERRFVLSVADSLAAKGFAGIAIDFAFHGERTHCSWNGPACIPNPLSEQGDMICPDPCKGGSTCGVDGKCYGSNGQQTDFSEWPIIGNYYQASGAAFVDVASIPGSRDHFLQGITDLGALSRSIRKGNWAKAIGYALDTSKINYVGQSLGGIMGALYTPLDENIERVVLNVPGANMVPLFQESILFSGHINALLDREGIEHGSDDHKKFLNLARWFVDTVDPANVAKYLIKEPMPGVGMPKGRDVMIQMALADFIIPNKYTKYLAELSGVPRRDYLAEHAFIVIPVEPAYIRGTSEMSGFLAGSFKP
jgi:hypothetical protein